MSPYYYHTLRVRYAETDQMGVVYHARYLDWFEVGRTEMIRECGMEYRKLEDEKGLLLPVIDLSVQYKKPAHYDDWVVIATRVTGFSGIRLDYEYEIRRRDDNELLVSGTTRHIWVNRQWKPARIDREVPELYALLAQITEDGEG